MRTLQFFMNPFKRHLIENNVSYDTYCESWLYFVLLSTIYLYYCREPFNEAHDSTFGILEKY